MLDLYYMKSLSKKLQIRVTVVKSKKQIKDKTKKDDFSDFTIQFMIQDKLQSYHFLTHNEEYSQWQIKCPYKS